MTKKKSPGLDRFDRLKLIDAVKTPLGFFVLVVLVVEVIIGFIAKGTSGDVQLIMSYGMIVIIVALILIVSALSCWRPEALQGVRPNTNKHVSLEGVFEKVRIERVLCVSSLEFQELGIADDENILKNAFKNTDVIRNASLDQFRKKFTENSYQIVHVVSQVDPQRGSVLFSEDESISAEGLLTLLGICKAKLVCFACCDSLYLAAKLAPYINVISASGTIEDKKVISWIDCFYSMLSKGYPMSESYSVAMTTSDIPLVLLMKNDFIVDDPAV